MGPAADSLITSGRNIVLVAQRLRVQPEHQSHREELVNTAQQVLLDTTKVRLMPARAGRPGWGMLLPQGTPSQERDLPPFLPRSQAQSSLPME